MLLCCVHELCALSGGRTSVCGLFFLSVNQSRVSAGQVEKLLSCHIFRLFWWQTAATVTYFSSTAVPELHANIISALCLFDRLPRCLSRDNKYRYNWGGREKKRTQSQKEKQRQAWFPSFCPSLQLQSGSLFEPEFIGAHEAANQPAALLFCKVLQEGWGGGYQTSRDLYLISCKRLDD